MVLAAVDMEVGAEDLVEVLLGDLLQGPQRRGGGVGEQHEGPAACGPRTVRGVATAFLRGSVRTATRPGYPAGCLGVQGSLAAGAQGRATRDELQQVAGLALRSWPSA